MVNFHQVPEIMEEELQEAKRDTLFDWDHGATGMGVFMFGLGIHHKLQGFFGGFCHPTSTVVEKSLLFCC